MRRSETSWASAEESVRPVFLWRYFDPEGTQVGTSDRFLERAAAEEWMGTAWSDLLSSGVEEVALVDEERDRTLYRMGLRET